MLIYQIQLAFTSYEKQKGKKTINITEEIKRNFNYTITKKIFMLLLFFTCFYTLYFIGNTFIRNARLKLAKIIHILRPHYHPKIIGLIPKNKQKMYICVHEIIRLIIMKMKMKMKKRSH